MQVNTVNTNAAEAVLDANFLNPEPDPGNQFVLVNVTAIYNGESESTRNLPTISVLGGGTNVVIDTFDGPVIVAPEPKYDFSAEVFKGGQLVGNLVFQVPIEDIGTLVVLGSALDVSNPDSRKYFATS